MECLRCSKQIPKDHSKYCSFECFQKHSAKTRKQWLVCKNCGKDYWVKKFDYQKNGSSFCSMSCKSAYAQVNVSCAKCQKQYSLPQSKVKRLNYCSCKCFFEHKPEITLGSSNPNYKNGMRKVSRQMRGLAKYQRWREKVLKRDNHTCQNCGRSPSRLHLHHVKRLWQLIEEYPSKKIDVYDDYFYDDNNAITLCEACHCTTYGVDTDENWVNSRKILQGQS